MTLMSPCRLVSALVTLPILAIPATVAFLTAAPSCGVNCFPWFWWIWP
jgi:hypothetical protein